MSRTEGQLIHRAITFAAAAHKGQLRKGTELDYLSHPMEVLQILTQMGAPASLLAAGALHDVLEDTAVTERELRATFGDEITGLVLGHTEDKGRSWRERKLSNLAHLQNGSRELRMLVLADRLANARSQAADYAQIGEKLWERFNSKTDEQEWFMWESLRALSPLKEDGAAGDYYLELEEIANYLFRN